MSALRSEVLLARLSVLLLGQFSSLAVVIQAGVRSIQRLADQQQVLAREALARPPTGTIYLTARAPSGGLVVDDER